MTSNKTFITRLASQRVLMVVHSDDAIMLSVELRNLKHYCIILVHTLKHLLLAKGYKYYLMSLAQS